ncbi:zinc finger protein 501-like [Epinephelus fuscoguttatus]|uniref:zinc finger protein 501-like n=1 Tax=Epinephelus fuscoguttatus TaxID=293821 RepID=UPI0020D1DE75|nr:zinc finger protein 501-like [Epinephelus fuscoguttatus]
MTSDLEVLTLNLTAPGTPAVSLYTSEMAADPATPSLAILSSAEAASQHSALLMVTSQPSPDLTSVPFGLSLPAQDDATGQETSQNSLQRSVPAAGQPAGRAATVSTAERIKPVESSADVSEPQVELTSGVRKDIRTKKENQQQRRVFCEKCNKGFHYRHHLKQHMSCHDKPFSCDQCDKRFHREKTLQTHLQRHKVKQQERSKCCRAAAVTDSSDSRGIWRHTCYATNADVLFLRFRVHSEERPFRCTDCGKTFKLKRELVQHQVVHTGEKPFRCEECGAEFSGSCAFKTHMLVHGAKKPLMCDLCGKTFFYNSKLLEHQQVVHQDRETPQKDGQKGLSRVHVEENNFICATCRKSFHRKCTFVHHMWRHGKEMSNSCRLKEHITLHTGEKR